VKKPTLKSSLEKFIAKEGLGTETAGARLEAKKKSFSQNPDGGRKLESFGGRGPHED